MTRDLKDYKLCYVNRPWAYFTTRPIDQQWGEDWDVDPYETNAGLPYGPRNREETWDIIMVAFEGYSLREPKDGYKISPWSVQAINAGQIAWLCSSNMYNQFNNPVSIPAGTNLLDFCRLVKKTGGTVYLDTQMFSDEQLSDLEEAMAIGVTEAVAERHNDWEDEEETFDDIGLEVEFV